ncbi:UbiA prenyltransferase family-domain-containing protein [Pelagophyceae sp. CCMP2097]|nr:UbiA prenyltransferase family-domain-containing protein [Pelagophyceae sp. CCMP2097]
MFGVDAKHADAEVNKVAKPYSGPQGFAGWVRNALRFVGTHHHPESLVPHFVWPLWVWVKVVGPINVFKLLTGAAGYQVAKHCAAATLRGLALSMCYIMHADWYNDVCDVDTDAKNKPSRPIPSGRVSMTQGLAISVFYLVVGYAVVAFCAPAEDNVARAYGYAFTACCVSAFFYSDDFFPTRLYFRRSAVGRTATFIGIYASFDCLMYVQMCDALNLDLQSNALLAPAAAHLVSNALWNLSILLNKDLGDIAGDRASGLKTLPMAAGSPRNGVALGLGVYALTRFVHLLAHFCGAFQTHYAGLPVGFLAQLVDVVALLGYAVYAATQLPKLAFAKDHDDKGVRAFMSTFGTMTLGCFQLDVHAPQLFMH